jgi:hypothetical protein
VRYLLLIYDDPETWASMPDEDQNQITKEYSEYTQWLQDEGVYRGGDALQPVSTATTVRVRDGQQLVTDGPFAETKEILGGYYLIECDNLDKAIDAAGKLPASRTGSVEVRPIMAFPADGTG